MAKVFLNGALLAQQRVLALHLSQWLAAGVEELNGLFLELPQLVRSGLVAWGSRSYATELRELGLGPASAVDQIGAEVEIMSHFRNGFAEFKQLQNLRFELRRVSFAGLHFHSVLVSYVRGPEI
jgi:hypothetical protein